MDPKTARWSQIVFFDRDEVEALHHRERLLAKRSGSSRTPEFQVMGLPTWEDEAKIASITSRLNPSGYWPKEMLEGERTASMADFEHKIYPIWMGIEKKDHDAEALMTPDQAGATPVMLECLTMHRQDWAIYDSGEKPRRDSGDRKRMDALRRKAANAHG